MKPRRPPNLTEKVATLTRQAICACGCGRSLKGRKVEYHHMHERALGGADHADNYGAVIADDQDGRAENCHHKLTNGTKATTAGSSQHKVAKADRLEKARLALAGKLPPSPPAALTDKFATVYGGGIKAGKTAGLAANKLFGKGWDQRIVMEPKGDAAMLIPKRRGYRLDKPQKGKRR
jgi:hypothetical protein